MKTNHKRNFVAKTHNETVLSNTIKGPNGEVIICKDMTHHGPGREGFRNAKRGMKKFTQHRIRCAVKELIANELEEGAISEGDNDNEIKED